MYAGITFDEKVLHTSILEEWLHRIAEKGASFIELSPHPSVLDLKHYQTIAKKASNLNMAVHYHVPYFADPHGFQMDWNITERHGHLRQYEQLFDWIDTISNNTEVHYLVFHVASYNTHKKNAMDSTLRYLDILLNRIVTKHPQICLLAETLSVEDGAAIGNTWDELNTLMHTFQTEHLKICWDLCHDLRNHGFKTEHISTLDFKQIPYGHIHGYAADLQKSHVDLAPQQTVYEDALKQAHALGFNGLINLETLMACCGDDYKETALRNLEWTQQVLASLK